MPLVDSDIKRFLSGGATNTDPNASLGGVKSSTEIVNATLHNLYDIVTSAEALSGDAEYRCIYIQNNHATIIWTDVKVWIQQNTPSADTNIEIALAGEGINGTAETVANESTAPVGETFSAPATQATGLSVGTLNPGNFFAVWIKRTINANAVSVPGDDVILRVHGDFVG